MIYRYFVMKDFLFYFFALLSLGSALMIVFSKNTVNGAMAMILCFVGLAGLFALLEAYFLSVLQILVYAGAIMVLFLFIIMLLDVDQPTEDLDSPQPEGAAKGRSPIKLGAIGLVLSGALVFALWKSIRNLPYVDLIAAPAPECPFAFSTQIKAFASILFTKYILVVELTGLLLLMVIVGAIALSKPLAHKPKTDPQL